MPVLPRHFKLSLFFMLFLTTWAGSQTMSDSVSCTIEIGELPDQQYRLRARCINLGSSALELAFSLRLQRQDSQGNMAEGSQKGSFVIAPQEEKVVTEQQVNVTPGSILAVYLSLSDRAGNIVCRDSLMRIFPRRVDRDSMGTPQQKASTSENSNLQGNDPSLSLDVGGFVIDETRTRAGRDLYDLFYSRWLAMENVQGDYTIRFEELPFRGLNTIIKVYLNDSLLYEQIIQPNFEFLDQLAAWLANSLQYQVQQLKQVQNNLEDELIGTDIDIY